MQAVLPSHVPDRTQPATKEEDPSTGVRTPSARSHRLSPNREPPAFAVLFSRGAYIRAPFIPLSVCGEKP